VDALSWLLDRLKREGSAFTLVPGDIIGADGQTRERTGVFT
jgi:hypothetical protein